MPTPVIPTAKLNDRLLTHAPSPLSSRPKTERPKGGEVEWRDPDTLSRAMPPQGVLSRQCSTLPVNGGPRHVQKAGSRNHRALRRLMPYMLSAGGASSPLSS